MELNLTLDHLYGAVIMIFMLMPFFKGYRLLRVVTWVCLWQLLTPVRDAYIDLPLFIGGFIIAEIIYLKYSLSSGDEKKHAVK